MVNPCSVVDDRVTRVVIVDDHRTFADLLGAALDRESDFCCLGTASSVSTAVDLIQRVRPDLVVMDIRLGKESGFEAARRVRDVLADAVIVMVSAHQQVELIVRAARVGASAFAPKSGSLQEMLSVLREAKLGSMLVNPALFEHVNLSSSAPVTGGIDPLSAREREVLSLMAKALPPQEIASLLNISLSTCRGYVKSIHTKLGVRSQLEAVVKAHNLGLVEIKPDA